MSIGWHFGRASPDQKAREPQVEKFFGSDVVANLANALVREGIQNSLDARDDERLAPGEPVRIHIRLGHVTDADGFKPFATLLADHLSVQDPEQLPDRPQGNAPCRFLAFEDFATRGLQGNPQQCWPDEDPGNAFFNFFRAEGHSEKRADARGRHGLGKHVFARASRARCFFGLTRRSDDGHALLMGAAVLRMHKIGDDRFVPDGWFGERNPANGFVRPLEDGDAITRFANVFSLDRDATKDSGLSVVVPWLDDSIGRDEVVDAVLRGYFHPILGGELQVTVTDETGALTEIDAATIRQVIEARPADVRAFLLPLLKLAEFGLNVPADGFLQLTEPPSKPVWSAALIPDDVKDRLRNALQSQEAVAVRVPVKVKAKRSGSTEVTSAFDVFLKRDQTESDGQVIFIREGLIISDARPRATPGVRALVVINEGPLAGFLGDAENPAHTQWQKSQVEARYTYPEDRIRFVVQSVPQILRLMNVDQQTPDPSIWLDLFSVPASEPELKSPGKGDRKKPGGAAPPPVPPLPPAPPKRYRLDKTPGGFILRRGAPGAARPYAVFIRVAYDVRRGDPFKQGNYTVDDFELDKPPIRIHERRGVKATVGPSKNHLMVQITDDDFELAVEGFGTTRDLVTDPKLIPAPVGTAEPVATPAAPAPALVDVKEAVHGSAL